MEPVNNLRDAMFQAGRFGHVEATQGNGQVSYQVRKGFGNWLVHVVKWYSNKGYKQRIIEQRTVVLAKLGNLCGSLNQPETQSPQSLSGKRVQELNRHLRHGIRFQAGSLFILNTIYTPEVATENYALSDRLIASQFRTADAALKNLIIPGSKNNPHPHEGVDKEKFGAAYWEYAHTNTLGNEMYGVTENSECLKVNGGVALLEYALSKDENEKHKGTRLFRLQSINRNNDLGIDFKDWGIPDGTNKILLRLIGAAGCMETAMTTVSIGVKGPEALAADRQENEMRVENAPNQEMQKLHVQAFGKVAQLDDLCEQFMREDSVPS